jgi:two-component system cell cycle response regulator
MCARVLVIDDDPVNADLLGYLLRAFGHDPVLALEGEIALSEARRQPPDLVLCDIQMPRIDGFEVLRQLRMDDRFSKTPIVGVTALAMVGDREKILAAGFDGYLTKPITPETFVPQIEKFLLQQPATPRQWPAVGTVVASNKAAPIPQRQGYVLVVDDVPANVELLRHLITSLGVEVRAASNADVALQIARSGKPRLIVSDLHMPDADGLDLLAAAKSDPVLKEIPFVLISASVPTAEDKRRATAGGVDGLLIRPLDPETMLECFARFLPREED